MEVNEALKVNIIPTGTQTFVNDSAKPELEQTVVRPLMCCLYHVYTVYYIVQEVLWFISITRVCNKAAQSSVSGVQPIYTNMMTHNTLPGYVRLN